MTTTKTTAKAPKTAAKGKAPKTTGKTKAEFLAGKKDETQEIINTYFGEACENFELTGCWNPCFFSQACQNPITGTIYKGINQIVLSVLMDRKGLQTPYFATFSNIKDKGLGLKKGAKAFPVKFAKRAVRPAREGDDPRRVFTTDEGKFVAYFTQKYYSVFHLETMTEKGTDFIKQYEAALGLGKFSANDVSVTVKALLQKSGARVDIRRNIDAPCFVPALNRIQLPPAAIVTDLDEYHSAILHELCHWTAKNISSCKRELSQDRTKYAIEELHAEIGAGLLAQMLGIKYNPKTNVEYVRSWGRIVKDDKEALYNAVVTAQQIASELYDLYVKDVCALPAPAPVEITQDDPDLKAAREIPQTQKAPKALNPEKAPKCVKGRKPGTFNLLSGDWDE